MSTVLDPSAVNGGSPPPTGTGVNAGSPPAGVNGVPPTPGSVGAPPAPSDSVGLAQLRQQYETTKREYDRYSSLGKYEEIQSRVQLFNQVSQEANTLGEQL